MPVGGTPIGAALGPDVGPRLGTLLGTDVGATLGGVLGGDVGPAVGTALGAEACATVADADGAARYVNVEVGAELAHAVNIRTEAARRATLRRSRASWTMETSPSRVDDGTSRRPDCLMGGIAFDHGLEGARASSAESPRPCTTGRRPRAICRSRSTRSGRRSTGFVDALAIGAAGHALGLLAAESGHVSHPGGRLTTSRPALRRRTRQLTHAKGRRSEERRTPIEPSERFPAPRPSS